MNYLAWRNLLQNRTQFILGVGGVALALLLMLSLDALLAGLSTEGIQLPSERVPASPLSSTKAAAANCSTIPSWPRKRKPPASAASVPSKRLSNGPGSSRCPLFSDSGGNSARKTFGPRLQLLQTGGVQ